MHVADVRVHAPRAPAFILRADQSDARQSERHGCVHLPSLSLPRALTPIDHGDCRDVGGVGG